MHSISSCNRILLWIYLYFCFIVFVEVEAKDGDTECCFTLCDFDINKYRCNCTQPDDVCNNIIKECAFDDKSPEHCQSCVDDRSIIYKCHCEITAISCQMTSSEPATEPNTIATGTPKVTTSQTNVDDPETATKSNTKATGTPKVTTNQTNDDGGETATESNTIATRTPKVTTNQINDDGAEPTTEANTKATGTPKVTTNQTNDDDNTTNRSILILIVCGSVMLITLIVAGIIHCFKRRNDLTNDDGNHVHHQPSINNDYHEYEEPLDPATLIPIPTLTRGDTLPSYPSHHPPPPRQRSDLATGVPTSHLPNRHYQQPISASRSPRPPQGANIDIIESISSQVAQKQNDDRQVNIGTVNIDTNNLTVSYY
ncbi:uncharacterized protein [Amphiura filiformis]|uniref:uncharacterized protein n=1 Tax=Amphiura filiformis TaxID=82378 RepID=UPI003B21DF69